MWPVIRTALQRPQIIVVLALLFLVTDALLAIFSPASAAGHPDRLHPADFPGTETLLEAPDDADNWLLPAKTYSGNRYTELRQIDKGNVGTLRMAWETSLADDGEQEAAPLIWNGTMYLSTPHDGVLALDASNGKLRWQTPYNPKYVLLYAVNRGVGLADGNVFIATQDCRVIALDAATGRSRWNVQGCRDTSNSFYSMAAYVYKNQLILGTGVAMTAISGSSAPSASRTASACGIGKLFRALVSPATKPGPASPGGTVGAPFGVDWRSTKPTTPCSWRRAIPAPTWS